MNLIRQIKEAVAARLAAWPDWAGIPIFTDHDANLRGKVDAAMATNRAAGVKGGVYVLVSVPSSQDRLPNVNFGPNTHALAVIVEEDFYDNLGTNGFGITGDDICTTAKELLKNWAVHDLCWIHDPQRVFALTPPDPLNGKRVSTLALLADERTGQGFPLGKVATPTASVSEGLATLSCATATAAVYYSLDATATTQGTYPSSAAGATLYSAPFSVTSGQIIRACGYLTDYIPSDSYRLTVT